LKFTGCVSSVALMSSRHILIVLSASHVTNLQYAQHRHQQNRFCSRYPMSLWLPCGLHGFAVPNTVTITVE
jgi:hypothetical protein